jgi:O-antigen/teichoic acid export membrane protein
VVRIGRSFMSELITPQTEENFQVKHVVGLRVIASRFARASAIYSLANFSNRAINFLLIPLYLHYLTPADYGAIYLAESIAIFVILLGNLSIDTAIQRLYFQHYLNPTELNSFLGTAMKFGLGAMVVVVVIAFLAGPSLQRSLSLALELPFYPLIAISVVTAGFTQGVQYRLAVFQADRNPRNYAKISILLFSLTTCCCLYAVAVRHNGAVGMLAGKLLASAIVFVIIAWGMRKYFFATFQWRLVQETLAFSVPLVPHQVMAVGLIVADRFILKHYRNLDEVGVYSLAYTLGMVMLLVTQSLSQAWSPMFFELAAGPKENRRILGRMSSGFLIGLVALACAGIFLVPQFVHFAVNYKYRVAGQIAPIVIMGYLFHACFSFFGLSIMHSKRTSYIFVVSFLACTVNLLLNFVLVPRWGMYGAAWATLIAYACEAFCAFAIAQTFFSLPYSPVEIASSLAVCGSALWFTQTRWSSVQHWELVPGGLVVSMVLLGLIGRRDIMAVFKGVRGDLLQRRS